MRADATLEEGWFYEGGGIYRHVWLNKTSPIHVAQDGIAINTQFSKGNLNEPVVHIRADIQNNSHENAHFHVSHKLLDKEGKEVKGVCTEGKDTPILPAITETTYDKIQLRDAHLWSIDDPYLYTLVTEVRVDGELVDTHREKFGIRDIRFDKDRGFLLNGEVVKLKGVNLHQDHAGVGAGLTDGMQIYRIQKLKEMGCNAYRSSHNPMSPAMLNVCDSLGMLVIDENRLSGCSEYEISQLEKMIRRDRNHPSIILWSVGNEEWGIEWDKKGEKIAATMRDYCHRFDPTREMTFATSGGPTVEVPVDVAGYNYVMQNPIEEHRKNYPERK